MTILFIRCRPFGWPYLLLITAFAFEASSLRLAAGTYLPEPYAQQIEDHAALTAAHQAARAEIHDNPAALRRVLTPAEKSFKDRPGFTSALRLMMDGADALWALQFGGSRPYFNKAQRLVSRVTDDTFRAESFLQKRFPEKARPLALGYAVAEGVLMNYGRALLWAAWAGEAFPRDARTAAGAAAADYLGIAWNTGTQPNLPLPPSEKRPSAKDIASWKAAAAALKQAHSLEPLLHPKTPLLKYAAWVLRLRLAALKAKVNQQWLAKLAALRQKRQQATLAAINSEMLARAQTIFQKRLKALDALQVGPNSVAKIARLLGPAQAAWSRVVRAMERTGRFVPMRHGGVSVAPFLLNIPNYAAIKKDFPGTDEAAVCHLFWEFDFLHNWKAVRDYLAASHLNLADPRVVYLDASVKNAEGKNRQAIQELRKYLKKHPNHPSLRMMEGQLDGTWRPPPG